MSATDLRLCWETYVESKASGGAFRVMTDAQTGELVLRNCLTAHQAQTQYRVFTSDSPTPLSPGYATTGITQQPAQAQRQLLTLRSLDAIASPNGWVLNMDIPTAQHFTEGNNVLAFADRDADGVVGLTEFPTAGTSLVFDFNLDQIGRAS